MRNYEEIKEFLLNFNSNPLKDSEKQEILKEIAIQLNFKFKDCGCKSLTVTLYEKLTIWLKKHTSLCHYRMEPGVLLRTKSGELCTAVTVTDEMAEELMQSESNKQFFKQILPFDNEKEEQPVTNEEIETLNNEVAKKKGKRKINK